MKFETKADKNACVVNLTITADAEECKADAKKVLGMFVREGVIPGFRKGKAPVALVQSKFAAEIADETRHALFRSFYPKALEETKLEPINLDGVSEITFDDAGFVCTAVVEVRPAFKLPKYKGLSIKQGDVTVKDEQVDESLAQFRASFASYEDAKDGEAVATGDFVQIDYAGTLDDKPLAEIVPDQKAVCGAEGFWLLAEEGRFVPELLKALDGMKVGESKSKIAVKFPKDAAPEAIRGKKCVYTLALKGLRKRRLPDDKAFAEAAKEESFEKLRANVRTRLEKQAVDAELNARRDQAIGLLLKKCDFDVPPVFVQRQVEMSLQRLAQQAQYAGLTADYIEQNRDKILADARENAEKQVRLSYILSEIAKAENITVDEKDADRAEGLKAEKALDLVLAEAK